MDDAKEVLRLILQHEQDHELSIVKLSEQIVGATGSGAQDEVTRSSAISVDSRAGLSPESLESDLTHYKELFSKLRFSYIEQVTKEKFLRAIIGDRPLLVDEQQNVELEAELVDMKGSLQAQKAEVEDMLKNLTGRGCDLFKRHQEVQRQTAQLQCLPGEIMELRNDIDSLKAAQTSEPAHPYMALSLPETQALLAEQVAEHEMLNQQLSSLEAEVSLKSGQLEKAEVKLEQLQSQKGSIVAAAKEARRSREDNLSRQGSDVKLQGRWYAAAEACLKEMLEI